MIRYEDDCVGCPQGCIDCGRKRTPHLYCDECDDELYTDDVYKVDGKMLCSECVLGMFKADWIDFD